MSRRALNWKKIEQIILSQTGTFNKDTIATAAQISPSAAYTKIQEMLGKSQIKLDHKQGGKMFFAISGQVGNHMPMVSNVAKIFTLTPAERFMYVADLANMVIDGISPSLLVTGIAGIGKTYLVKKQLEINGKTDGMDFHFCSGHSSPMGLYKFLHDHRDSIIVFDDCDSVFADSTSVNILKSALDSYDIRKVCWQSSRMPEDVEPEFNFEGQVIFISNLDSSRIDPAVLSRTIVIDLQMSRKEISEYMWTLINDLEPRMELGKKQEVMRYLDESRENFEQYNLRTFIKACRIRRTADIRGTDWKKMILVLN